MKQVVLCLKTLKWIQKRYFFLFLIKICLSFISKLSFFYLYSNHLHFCCIFWILRLLHFFHWYFARYHQKNCFDSHNWTVFTSVIWRKCTGHWIWLKNAFNEFRILIAGISFAEKRVWKIQYYFWKYLYSLFIK